MKTNARRLFGGFTIIEVLLVVAVISVIGSATFYTVTTTQETARERKLEADVASINSAAQIYLANGGNLPADLAEDQVLDKLKTRADSATGSKSTGLKGSAIDSRIVSVWQGSEEAANARLRARWDGGARRFVLGRDGGAGIKRFEFDAALAAENPVVEARDNHLAAATETQWVWDYNENTNTTPALGTAPGSGTGAGYTAPTGSGKNVLAGPNFSHQGGPIPLIQYLLPVTLSNPNASGTSQIFYSLAGSPYILYKGETLSVQPDQSINAYAASVDPDHWEDSAIVPKNYTAIPVTLGISLNVPQSSMTFQEAGGQMTNQALATPPPATVNLLSTSQIPTGYLNSSNFQIYYTTDGTDPATSQTAAAGTSFAGVFASPQIGVDITRWGTASSLTIKAIARSLNAPYFTTSSVVSQSIDITPTSLQAPVITPSSGVRSDTLPISIALAAGGAYPADARIYYTTNGTDPGNSNGEPSSGTLYSAPFQLGVSNSVIRARVYGPASSRQWFTPSAPAEGSYFTESTPDGALVGNAEIYGAAFEGSIIYAKPAVGQTMLNITFTQGARILKGNLYLPGTPNIYNGWVGDPVKWTPANDGSFASRIQGRQFTAAGVEILNDPSWSASPRVIDQGQTLTPTNYHLVFYNNSYIEGKIYRQSNAPSLPTVAQPPSKANNNSLDYGSYRLPPPGGLSSSPNANLTLNSGSQPLILLPGNFGTLTANNNTVIRLGDSSNPDVVQYYSADSLNLNGGSKLVIVGKVVLTLRSRVEINNGSILGNAAHPDWLRLQFYTTSTNTPQMFAANSGSAAYAAVVAPNAAVDLNNGSVFNGSVTARLLRITSNSVVFSIPPVIAQ